MDKRIYLDELDKLANLFAKTKNTPFSMYAKVLSLTIVYARHEKLSVSSKLNEHPYVLMKEILNDAIMQFKVLMNASFIESENKNINDFKSHFKEEKHCELFNEIWDTYDEKGFAKYIDRYVYRLTINDLGELIKGKKCVDLGCGNGVFCFALLECGAGFAAGIDFGEKSIEYAKKIAEKKALQEKSIFKKATVYDTGFENDSFDFAIQNGVFHHLNDEEKAVREAKRILKRGGWFWYYSVGGGGINDDLYNASVKMLRDVPVVFIKSVLRSMNVSDNKLVFLSDGLSATYERTTWKKVTGILSNNGFGNFRRLRGGFDTDWDLEKIQNDPYGKEKLGEGDLRILCQLIDK